MGSRVCIFLVCSWLVAACGTSAPTGSGTAPRSEPAATRTVFSRPVVAVVKEPTYPNRVRVGGSGNLRLTLRNDGPSAVQGIQLRINQGLFDGFILDSAVPPVTEDRNVLSRRILSLEGLAPAEEREYRINLIAKTAGEYDGSLGIYADDQSVGSAYSIRMIVTP